jgi:hypothetical protein
MSETIGIHSIPPSHAETVRVRMQDISHPSVCTCVDVDALLATVQNNEIDVRKVLAARTEQTEHVKSDCSTGNTSLESSMRDPIFGTRGDGDCVPRLILRVVHVKTADAASLIVPAETMLVAGSDQ